MTTLTKPLFDERTTHLYEQMGFEATERQLPILVDDARFILVTGGSQAGKSYLAGPKLVKEFWIDQERGKANNYRFPLIYWLVAADYERTFYEFNYILSAFDEFGLVVNSSKRVDAPGFIEIGSGSDNVIAIIKCKTASDYRRLAMEAPMGIITCEGSQLDLETYYRLQERCAAHKAWMFQSGTMEGSLGWYPSLAQAWYGGIVDQNGNKCKAYALPSWSNKHLYPGGENDPEILRLKRELSDERYRERVEGVPCPPSGLVLKEFRPDIHIQPVEYQPGTPVQVWIDPGYGHPGAVEAIHIIEGQVQVFDEIFEVGLIDEEFIKVCQNKPWWKDVNYGVVDIAANQHQGRAAIADVWQKMARLNLRSQKVPINEGTERFRGFLKPDPLTRVPKIVFNPRCKGIISELGGGPSPIDNQTHVYRWKTDREGNIVGDTPDDKNNDGIKAIIYGLVDNFGYATANARGNQVNIRRSWLRK